MAQRSVSQRSEAGGDPGRTDGKNRRCRTDRYWSGAEHGDAKRAERCREPGPTNLQEAGITIDRNTLAVRMINELRSSLTLFEQEGLAPFLSRWEKLDNFINRPVKLLIGDKEIYGTSRGIDAQGALLLEQDGVIKPGWAVKFRYEVQSNPLPTGERV